MKIKLIKPSKYGFSYFRRDPYPRKAIYKLYINDMAIPIEFEILFGDSGYIIKNNNKPHLIKYLDVSLNFLLQLPYDPTGIDVDKLEFKVYSIFNKVNELILIKSPNPDPNSEPVIIIDYIKYYKFMIYDNKLYKNKGYILEAEPFMMKPYDNEFLYLYLKEYHPQLFNVR